MKFTKLRFCRIMFLSPRPPALHLILLHIISHRFVRSTTLGRTRSWKWPLTKQEQLEKFTETSSWLLEYVISLRWVRKVKFFNVHSRNKANLVSQKTKKIIHYPRKFPVYIISTLTIVCCRTTLWKIREVGDDRLYLCHSQRRADDGFWSWLVNRSIGSDKN